MTIEELINILKDKKDKYWNADVYITQSLWFGEYRNLLIENILHNWEDWLRIYISNI